MSRRREVQTRLRQLGEIGEIMRSMKNLALMETRKLAAFVEAQRQGIAFLEEVAADFLHHHPQQMQASAQARRVLLLAGSERGFCGEFNERLIQRLQQEEPPYTLIAVGHKLADRLQDRGYEPIALDGATVTEELPEVIDRLIAALLDLQQSHPQLRLQALIAGEGDDSLALKSLLPPFTERPANVRPAMDPPMLYLTPGQFYRELTEHYLMALLSEIVHTALLAENEQRIRHLEGALQRMDEKTAELERKSQRLRQEEITEEIEIILLSVEGLGEPGRSGP